MVSATNLTPIAALLALGALSACGHNMEQRAATGAAAGLLVGGPVGAAVGAGVGAAVNEVDESSENSGD